MTSASRRRPLGDEMAPETGGNPFAEAKGGDRSVVLSQHHAEIRRHPQFALTRDDTIARLVALGQTSPLHRVCCWRRGGA